MQKSAHMSLYASALGAEFSDFEEAARYALLQRLVPAIRHDVMGNFQSMVMLTAMLDRRLQAAEPNLASLRETCASLASATRAAAGSSGDVMRWIEGKTSTSLNFGAGLKECLALLTTGLRFRGFVVVNEVSGIDADISSSALRSVLCAAMLTLSDLSKAPAELIIRGHATPERVELSLHLRPTEAGIIASRPANYRPLGWRDVEILALAESVNLTLVNGGAQLSFPRATANQQDALINENSVSAR